MVSVCMLHNVIWKARGGLTEFAELAVGDEQCAKGAQALESLITVSLGRVLANGSIRGRDSLGIELSSLPDEVLKKVALILGQEELLGLLNNLTNIGNEFLAIIRELA